MKNSIAIRSSPLKRPDTCDSYAGRLTISAINFCCTSLTYSQSSRVWFKLDVGFMRESRRMNRRLASLILLVMMLAGGAYGAPPVRASHGIRVEITLSPRRRAEVQVEERIKTEFVRQRRAVLVSESPPVISHAGKALYQRPPPVATAP